MQKRLYKRGTVQGRNNSPTKDQILNVAERFFASKGFSETRIADISSALGIAQSTIYEHFQNKEEILFAIPKENTEELISINERHLRGLVGAETKLRKLIWNYMEYLGNHRDYTTILLFHLRSNRDFYNTENYQLLKKFTKPYREAVVEGQSHREFRDDIQPYVILNLIFGSIDMILITWLIKNDPQEPLVMFEDLFCLLMRSIRANFTEVTEEETKKRILDAAAKVFYKSGYDKARIQDIAALVGLADATIYKYFSSKEDILFTLPIEKTKELMFIVGQELNETGDPRIRIDALLRNYLYYLDIHRQYSSIVLFDLRFNRGFYHTEAYKIFRKFARIFYEALVDIISIEQLWGRSNPYVATKMIFGLIDHLLISSLKFGRPAALSELSDQICKLVISSVTR